jgi:murein DD-endopeptidase MepM/ murein hydrolase activator NlpD
VRPSRLLVVAAFLGSAFYLLANQPHVRAFWRVATAEAPSTLVVPVQGVKRATLRSSFGAPRPGNRQHQGIDILAPRGTLVVAADAGVVTGTRPNRLGGNVVWAAGAGRRLYYYAHLQEVAADVGPGRLLAAGDVLGSVGTSGNAAGGPPHLHFGIYAVSHLRFAAIDPHPLLAPNPE